MASDENKSHMDVAHNSGGDGDNPAEHKAHVGFTGVSETMLSTLASRAQDAARPPGESFLGDTWAKMTLDRLDYQVPQTISDEGFNMSILQRAKLFDIWTAEFLDAHPDGATVLHLACGLDSRALRLDWNRPTGNFRWIDVDVPEVAELRRKVLPSPAGDYTVLALNVNDDDWLEQIPADRPTLVVMEGLLMYLELSEIERLVKRVCDRFPTGQIAADAIGSFLLRVQSINRPIARTGAVMKSSIEDASLLEAMHTKLKVRDQVRMGERPGTDRFPWYLRWSVRFYSLIPAMRALSTDMRLDF